MIKPYLTELETRLHGVRDLIGDTSAHSDEDIKQAQQKLNEIIAKFSTNKEIQRKCIANIKLRSKTEYLCQQARGPGGQHAYAGKN